MFDKQSPWTTTDGARMLLDDVRDALAKSLRHHGQKLIEAAADFEEPKLSSTWIDKNAFGGDRDVGIRAMMLAIAARDMSDATFMVEQDWQAKNPLHGRALALEKALTAFAQIAESTWDPDRPLKVNEEACDVIRAELGKWVPGILKAGDRVAWRESDEADAVKTLDYTGIIVAISDGVAMLNNLSCKTTFGSSSVKGVKLQPVAGLRLDRDRF